MRDPKRIKRILGLLEELWNTHPDQRFGQLWENYISGCEVHGDRGCMFHIEDKEWEREFKRLVKDGKKTGNNTKDK